MPTEVDNILCPFGAWISVAEQRDGRQSLVVSLTRGDVILSPSKNMPSQPNVYGIMPTGIFRSISDGVGPNELVLQRAVDGDVVKMEWFAYCPFPLGFSPTPTAQLFTADGTWTAPAGIWSVNVECVGGGGGSCDANAADFLGTGGGGGGANSRGTIDVVPGMVYTVKVGQKGTANHGQNAGPSWFSTTGVAPTTTTEGVLAVGGANGALSPSSSAGAGGLASACIGTSATNGGNGGPGAGTGTAFTQDAGGGGGGGSTLIGSPSASINGTIGGAFPPASAFGGTGGTTGGGAGGNGNGGINVPDGTAGGGTGAGGGGAAINNSLAPPTISGLGADGSAGAVRLTWPTTNASSVYLTVLDSFDAAEPPPAWINVPLQRLSKPAIEALHDLLRRLGAQYHYDTGHKEE